MSAENNFRIAIEKTIVTQVIDSALAIGDFIGLETSDGEEIMESFTKDREKILDNVFACDDARIFLSKDGVKYYGWILCVYGNDGVDVLSDYTTNLEELLTEANRIGNQIEDGNFTINVKA